MTRDRWTVAGVLLTAAFCCGGLIPALGQPPADSSESANETAREPASDVVDAQPKLLRIAAVIDGSGRIMFTRESVRYEHKHWARPTEMMFDGEAWVDLSQTPPAWRDVVDRLDLTKAWIVKRQGRDVIALEHTPDGFDLYLSDSPNSGTHYEVTIAIPRRN